MSTIVEKIEKLPNMISFTNATADQIKNAEAELNLRFADEYRDYLAAFGAVVADGTELTGIANSEHRKVTAVTKREWELNPQVPHSMYVVENVGIDGIIIWQDASGTIYQSLPKKDPEKIFEDLADYLSSKEK
ncbi:SMI1/KNR4 family protein [Synergistaceae bacterium OttesenSCG-928-D05]|nr:SMI1/KNR4 family protein [Synergistaceae bacterium OttesenSCG-928-D05]